MNTNTISSFTTVLAATLTGVVFAFPVHAGGDSYSKGTTSCERTARQMHSACRNDVRDNYHETIANCLNLATRGERRECRHLAIDIRVDERGTCHEVHDARVSACEVLGENRYDMDPLLDPSIYFIDPNDVPGMYGPNPYVSIAAGHTFVLRSGDEGQETVVVHVTEESREIQGVLCRVVLDVVVEVSEENGTVEYEGVESTDDWFAQDTIGNVYYCGEISRNFEDGILRDLDGSFEAGQGFAKGGLLTQAFPVANYAHRQEFALGEAEDIVQYLDPATAPSAAEGGDNPAYPCSPNLCLKTFDFAPLEPEATEFKYYLPGTGFVLAVGMEDGELTGEREERVCDGDSLAILSTPACEIADPDALADALCELAGGPFCE